MTALHFGTLSIRLNEEKTNQESKVLKKLEALQDLMV
jgi:hypothetical protein